MIWLLLTAVLIPDGGSAQSSEDTCDLQDLKLCVDATPRTQIGLPRNKEELDKHCLAYQTGMACMDTWIKRCLPTDGQKIVQQQIGGARALMRYLCTNDTALRKDFLKESPCWSLVSSDWSHCVEELQLAAREISERSHHIVYFNKNTELCCARDAFVSCVSRAGRVCMPSSAALLRRMAWVLAKDVAACSQQPRVVCRASQQKTLTLLAALSSMLLCPLAP